MIRYRITGKQGTKLEPFLDATLLMTVNLKAVLLDGGLMKVEKA